MRVFSTLAEAETARNHFGPNYRIYKVTRESETLYVIDSHARTAAGRAAVTWGAEATPVAEAPMQPSAEDIQQAIDQLQRMLHGTAQP